MTVRRINSASLGEFLCAKFEISLQTQENSAVGQVTGVAVGQKSYYPNFDVED